MRGKTYTAADRLSRRLRVSDENLEDKLDINE